MSSSSWQVLTRDLREHELTVHRLLQEAAPNSDAFMKVENRLQIAIGEFEGVVNELWQERRDMEQLAKARKARQDLSRIREEFISLQTKAYNVQFRKQLFDYDEASVTSDSVALLDKERGSIARSLNSVSGTTAQAAQVFHSLRRDNSMLNRSRDAMTAISRRVPLVSSVIDRIRNKKTRDNTIVAIVVAACIIVLMLLRFG